MQQLIGYLFRKYVTDSENQLTKELCSLKTILLSELKPTQDELQLIQYLLAKNIVCYSATHLTITLNLQMVLSYQRIQKLRQFSSQHLEKQFGELLDRFIGN